ncbi:MAG: L-threonylcarbamoyladenylate synthase [Pseudomonadota bacterium]
MSQFFEIHPQNPQPRLIRQAAEIVRAGGVIVYPTDSCYALGCQLGDKAALERMRQIRGVGDDHFFTLVCRDLSEIANYARVSNQQYRMLKAATPGSYTFILAATREVPRRLQHPKRNTVGLRVPDHAVVQALLAELGEPLLSTTLLLPDADTPLNNAADMRTHLERRVDLILDGGSCGMQPTTVVDLTGDASVVLRHGKGDPGLFG